MSNLNFPEVKDRDPNAKVDLEILNDTIEYIRPAVQADGGDIKLASVEDGVVNIEMLGACQGCPMSIATLKSGIERILKDKVPGVTEVISTVCDKSFGIAIYSYCSVPSIKLYGVVFLDQLVSFKSILS